MGTKTPKTDKPLKSGRVRAKQARRLSPPQTGVRRYVLTSAQNNTPAYKDCWYNLLALAQHYDARVMVSRYTYDKSSYGEGSIKPGTGKASDYDGLWYDPEVLPYASDDRVELAPGLVWCGELNILPTAVDPLSGLESYTGRASAIVPHAKFAMDSVASGKAEATKFNYTTGTVTQRNYIQKKAGLKAEHHHGYGAVLVEVASDGSWFVRQLKATPDGSVRDLDLLARGGVVTDGHRVEAITWGDVHTRMVDPEVRSLCWGGGGMLDALRPRFQFVHDVLDFRSRNYHDAKNGLRLYARHASGSESVEDEVREVGELLDYASRDWCETVVVDSNHDRAMERWLVETDYRRDPVNALYYLEASLAVHRALRDGDADFHLLEWAVRRYGHDLPRRVPGRHLQHDGPRLQPRAFQLEPLARGHVPGGHPQHRHDVERAMARLRRFSHPSRTTSKRALSLASSALRKARRPRRAVASEGLARPCHAHVERHGRQVHSHLPERPRPRLASETRDTSSLQGPVLSTLIEEEHEAHVNGARVRVGEYWPVPDCMQVISQGGSLSIEAGKACKHPVEPTESRAQKGPLRTACIERAVDANRGPGDIALGIGALHLHELVVGKHDRSSGISSGKAVPSNHHYALECVDGLLIGYGYYGHGRLLSRCKKVKLRSV